MLNTLFKNSNDGPKGEMFDNYLNFLNNAEGNWVHFADIVPSF